MEGIVARFQHLDHADIIIAETIQSLLAKLEYEEKFLLSLGVPKEALIYISRNATQRLGTFYYERSEIVRSIQDSFDFDDQKAIYRYGLKHTVIDGRNAEKLVGELKTSLKLLSKGEWEEHIQRFIAYNLLTRMEIDDYWAVLRRYRILRDR